MLCHYSTDYCTFRCLLVYSSIPKYNPLKQSRGKWNGSFIRVLCKYWCAGMLVTSPSSVCLIASNVWQCRTCPKRKFTPTSQIPSSLKQDKTIFWNHCAHNDIITIKKKVEKIRNVRNQKKITKLKIRNFSHCQLRFFY